MSAFNAIDLQKLPAPTIVDRKGFEVILAEIKDWIVTQEPDLDAVLGLESEPITKVLEAWAYRETLLRAEFDEAGRGNMLAYAVGAQLDHLAAFFGVERGVVQVADSEAVPPVPEILETDTRLRRRVNLAIEGYSAAGPIGAYVFWGLSADATVKDVSVQSPNPGEVLITVLSDVADGDPDQPLLDAVEAGLSAEDVRPLCDTVIVQAASIIPYVVEAELTLYEGPDSAVVLAAAQAATETLVADLHRLGHDISISAIHAALHQPGVQNVVLTHPAGHIEVDPGEAAYCTSIDLTVGGRDV